MSAYGSTTVKRTRRTRAAIKGLDGVLYELARTNQPITVRGLFYRAEVGGHVPKDEAKGYRVVQRRLVALRASGVIPYGWITDGSRMIHGVDRYTGLDDFAAQSARLYRRDYWARSAVRVEVWLEKDALAGVLYPVVVNEWGLDLYVTRGFASVSYLENAAAAARHDGRPTAIYVLTDLDPSGVDIARKVAVELPRRAPKVEITVERLAVTPEQVRALALPTRPTKQTDTRAKKFEARYGTESVELDAIAPSTLRGMVSAAVARHADTAEHRRLKEIETLERQSLIKGLGFGGADGSEAWQ